MGKLWIGVLVLVAFGAYAEQIMTEQERIEMRQAQQEWTRAQRIASEATLPDAEFVKKMVRDDLQWCGDTLVQKLKELGVCRRELMRAR